MGSSDAERPGVFDQATLDTAALLEDVVESRTGPVSARLVPNSNAKALGVKAEKLRRTRQSPNGRKWAVR